MSTESAFPNECTSGMSLLDYFAAKAMHTLLLNPVRQWDEVAIASYEIASYEMAEAMMAERKRRSEVTSNCTIVGSIEERDVEIE